MSLLKPKWLFGTKKLKPANDPTTLEVEKGKVNPKALRCACRLRDNWIADEQNAHAKQMREAYGTVLKSFGYVVPTTVREAKILAKILREL